jgi:hypothetical protein
VDTRDLGGRRNGRQRQEGADHAESGAAAEKLTAYACDATMSICALLAVACPACDRSCDRRSPVEFGRLLPPVLHTDLASVQFVNTLSTRLAG